MNHSSDEAPPEHSKSFWTIPNTLCLIRLCGSPILLLIASRQQSQIFLWLFLFLLMTDWIDGKLAILLNQRSVYGARLDSFADASLYGCTLLGVGWLRWDFFEQQAGWLFVMLGSYVLTSTAGLIKFGRIPSYHTRAAKICWLLAGLATVGLLLNWSPWFFRITILGVTYTNLETVAMTVVLPEWTSDVLNLREAMKIKRGQEADESRNEEER
ncbi:MAG: CDP-alcohol phosphatidyltransferase family protein [Planctomycetaceae bacterium]|nr:CDP-alcohol phosphatidyltransferase family protein [Planctomycetaceae bacterium]